MTADSGNPDFWAVRYRSGTVPWDLRGSPPALITYLRTASSGGRVLIPGCGYGYEVKAFHEAGWQPVAIDFSPEAVAQARERLGPLAGFVRWGDFFSPDIAGPYDLVYERTFLCALPLDRWPAYAGRMRALVRPGGVLAGIFYHGVDPDGPPFPINAAKAAALLQGFELKVDRPIPPEESLPLHAGFERWQEWVRRD